MDVGSWGYYPWVEFARKSSVAGDVIPDGADGHNWVVGAGVDTLLKAPP